MKLATTKLQEMLVKVIKGASFNKLIPMSSLMAIKVDNNVLTLMTTDGTNYMYVKEQTKAKDFYVVVNADVFSKLVAKTTSENVELTLTKDSLVVTGNGTYKIALELDADGTLAKLPDPIADKDFKDVKETINLSIVNTIINVAKPSLMSTTMEVPCYTGYYIGDRVIATDATQICGIDTKMFAGDDVLLSPALLDLVGLMNEENIKVSRDKDTITFITDNCIVYGKVMAYLDDYDTVAITQLLKGGFGTKCSVSKVDFLSVLERLSLFVGKYEKNQITLAFKENGIEVSSQSSNAVEFINYISHSDVVEEYTCIINIEMLQTQLKAYAKDSVEIWYKNEANNAIKFVDNSVTQIIALCE